MKFRRMFRNTAVLSLAVLGVTYTRAADAPTGGPAVVGSLTIASADKLKEFADTAGIPLPPFLTPAGVETTFPFIGNGKLKTDAPAAMALVMGKDLNQQQGMIFVLPVKPGGGELSSIPNTTKTDAADTVVAANGMAFRRNDDYLLFGGTGAVTSKFDTASLADKVKPGTTADGKSETAILHLEIDLKKIREVDPEKLSQGLAAAGSDKDNPGVQAVQDFVGKVDRFDADLKQVGDDYALSARIAPQHIDAGKIDRAGLPDDCVLRADLALTTEQVKELVDQSSKGEKLTDADRAKVELFESTLTGKSESIGLSPMNGGTLVVVVQHPKAGNFSADLKSAVDRLKSDKDTVAVSLGEYQSAAGLPVERVSLTDTKDKSVLYLDTLPKGDALYTTISFSDAHQVEGLIGLKSEGTTTSPSSGWIKLADTLKLFQSLQSKLDPAAHPDPIPQSVLDSLGGKPLVWSAENDGDGLRFTVGLPKALVQVIGKLAGGM